MGIHALPLRNHPVFEDLQGLVRAVEGASAGSPSPISVRKLEQLSARMMLVEPSDRRRNYKVLYSGDIIEAIWQTKIEGKKFRDIREACSEEHWPRVRQSLQGFSDAVSLRAPVLRRWCVSFGPYRGSGYTRLIIPIVRDRKVVQLAAAYVFDDDRL